MLKGIVMAAAGAEELRVTLEEEGMSVVRLEKLEEEAVSEALWKLGAEREEVLCLVERDVEEKLALDAGLICVGYLNPAYKEESLRGCKILLEGFEEIDSTFFHNVHTRAMGLPVQIAETSRLLIREMTLEDMDKVDELYRESESACFGLEFPENRQEEEDKIKAYIAYMYGLYQFGMWVVIEKKSQRLIGRAGFGIADYRGFSEIDLGYLIDPDYRCQGYGEEACRAVLEYGRSVLDFPQVSAYIARENVKSLGLIEKLGFQKKEAFSYEERDVYRYLLKF